MRSSPHKLRVWSWFVIFSNVLFCELCLTHFGFVQCYSLGSLKVCSFVGGLCHWVMFLLRVFCLTKSSSCSAPVNCLHTCDPLLYSLTRVLLCGQVCLTLRQASAALSPPVEFARFCFCFLPWFSNAFRLRALPHKIRDAILHTYVL